MERIHVGLKNCYGIKELEQVFDFTKHRAHLIYAPNGAMKSSFARVFNDRQEGRSPQDRIFPTRTSECVIADSGIDIDGDRILVVEPYQETFYSTKISTLLVNKQLKERYESIHESIDNKKEELLKQIKPLAERKTDIVSEFCRSFGVDIKEFLSKLENLEKEVCNEKEPNFSDIVYSEVFNDKVLGFLQKPSIRQDIAEYVEQYNELIDASTYFKKGVFNHNNAATVGKSLKDNGFFAASHAVLLNSNEDRKEILTQKEMDKVIEEEKNTILNNPELSERFEKIDKEITRNADLKQFRTYLENNLKILPELQDPNLFRQTLWISYLKSERQTLEELLRLLRAGKKEIKGIIEEAKKEATAWERVVEIFNKRFSVPFKLEISNKEDVILSAEPPSISFIYIDGEDKAEVGREELLNVLSMGEKKALYMLNIIFEIEARKGTSDYSLIVIDDIADSFDYKNKYAIIEYIKEILEEDSFFMILLTHNFDFFRTVQRRLSIHRDNCYMTMKTEDNIRLLKADYLKNPLDHWKKNLHADNKMFVAAIPLVRNLVEYADGKDIDDYRKLTSLLHIKSDSTAITMETLQEILKRRLTSNLGEDSLGADSVLEFIFTQAESCMQDDSETKLENKIVLSIAIRLKAEDFMISKIGDQSIISEIERKPNQTISLFKEYKNKFGADENIEVLERVNLMTPENIHLNSFMFEPILDISNHHLRQLYQDVKELKIAASSLA